LPSRSAKSTSDHRIDRKRRRGRRAYKLTGDITKIAAQVPALFEALSGMQMSDLLAKVRLIGDHAVKPAPPSLPNNS